MKMKVLSPDQLEALHFRRAGWNIITIARHLGFSHTLIGRWFSSGHYVNEAYERFIETGNIYPPTSGKSHPINTQIALAYSRWSDSRMAELESELGPVPRLPREKRKKVLMHYDKIIHAETSDFFKRYFKENPDLMTKEEIEQFFTAKISA